MSRAERLKKTSIVLSFLSFLRTTYLTAIIIPSHWQIRQGCHTDVASAPATNLVLKD